MMPVEIWCIHTRLDVLCLRFKFNMDAIGIPCAWIIIVANMRKLASAPASGLGLNLTLVYNIKLDDGEAIELNIVKRALEEPIRQIALNAGHEGAVVCSVRARFEGRELRLQCGDW